MAKTNTKNLSQLGKKVAIAASPDKARLETVPNPIKKYDYLVRFTCPEFTSLCPLTGQPDFAHIVIDYVPKKLLIESKSLKLFLQSFRNYGDFHEACTVGIGLRLIKAMDPKWLRIYGYWYPRGGIPIDVFFEEGTRPKTVFVPETGVSSYRGRG